MIDSEVLHRGAATGEGQGHGFSSTCTAQICSTEGWPALHRCGRADENLMGYTIPIQAKAKGGAAEGAAGAYTAMHSDMLPQAPDVLFAGAAADSGKGNGDGRKRRRSRDGSIAQQRPQQPQQQHSQQQDKEQPNLARMHDELCSRGVSELASGLPEQWAQWPAVQFVESMAHRYRDRISQELAMALLSEGPGERPGERAAVMVNEALREQGLGGITVHVPPASEQQIAPFQPSGPRFYVSVTDAALQFFGGALPPMPASMSSAIWPHHGDRMGAAWARGLGWCLAPGGADPQIVHADIWGGCEMHSRRERVRFPHLLWKRQRKPGRIVCCTTEFVPGGFTRGEVRVRFSELLFFAWAR